MSRAGIPLMELVFEPDLEDGEEAAALVKELILILQCLGTCSCKMEGTQHFQQAQHGISSSSMVRNKQTVIRQCIV